MQVMKRKTIRLLSAVTLLCLLVCVFSGCASGRYESDTIDDIAAVFIEYPEVEGNYHIGDPMNRMPVYQQPTAQITVYENGYYKADAGEAGMFDVARPAVNAGEKHPFILLVPGGSWLTANKASMKQYMLTLAHHGYVAAAISTRTLPDYGYNAQLEDVMDAAQYFYDNTQTYEIDTSKMHALGLSSGGNLVLNAAYSGGVGFVPDEKASGYKFKFKAVASVASPISALPLKDTMLAQNWGLVTNLLGVESASDAEEAIFRISPIEYINYDTPPTIAFSGQEDLSIPEEQAQILCEALQEWQIPCYWVSYTDTDHIKWPLERLLKDMCDFFELV